MANHSYMTITGKTQGKMSAGCSTGASVGNVYQSAFVDEIMVLSYTHNMANIGNLGSHANAEHGPIIITKYLDKSSPLLARALSEREEISCKFDFYRLKSNGGGAQEKFFSVSISGGIIADLTLDMPHSVLQSDASPQEHVSFRYRDISWTHHVAGTSGYSTWSDCV